MILGLRKIINRFGRAILLLVFVFCAIFLAKTVPNNQTTGISNLSSANTPTSTLSPTNSSSIATTSGALSGNAYVSNDTSAVSGSKITFGNPNSVSFSYSNSKQPSVEISTGSLLKSTPISPLDFGVNEVWYDGGYGTQNPVTNQTYASVIGLTKNIGVSVIRFPGGIPSDTYHWQNAIGPQNQRTDNIVYQQQDVFFPSTFGSDEFGQLLESTNSVGDITVNFGTGTAQEAANWVQYMTASQTNNDWGKLRAKNGHPAPYNIPYWEVGNETQSSAGENYWRSGSVVSIGDNSGQCQSSIVHLCEYVYGGTTAFSDQKALGTTVNPIGNGAPNQTFYAKYPPVVINSQTVYVNGSPWHQIGDITDASAGQQVYELNNTTGKISFGDGVHGAIVPVNAVVTISYQSGPHDGFIQYYKLMKAADPNIKVCSTYDDAAFIQLMGSNSPYDCLVSHLYAGNIPSTVESAELFHNNLMEQSYGFAAPIRNDQSDIKKYAGSRAKNIGLVVSEYGVNALTYPRNMPNYHRSQDMALFMANALRVMIDAHIPVAEKHYLISYQNSQPAGPQVYVNSNTFSNNALISGPGSDPVPQPSAYVLEAYTKLLYSNLISSTIHNNPSTIYSEGNYSSLSMVATTDNQGHEAMMVINLSGSQSIQAKLQPSVDNYKTVTSWTLGSNSYLAYNTPSDPTAVGFVEKSSNLHKGMIFANFPPASITVLQLK